MPSQWLPWECLGSLERHILLFRTLHLISPINMAAVRPVTLVQHPLFGPEPVVTTCTSCNKQVTTEISRHTSACSYITCILSIFVCCPCFWLPLVCPWFMDTIHECPNCKDTIGVYSRFN